MDFGEIQLGGNENTDLKKERRFSVHDVDSTDNEIPYGQPDNLAIDDVSAMRIASVDDVDPTVNKQSTRGSVASDSIDDDDQNGVFIHENVDNTYDDYGGNESIGNEYTQSPNLDATRGSKEATPDHDDKEYFDSTHYRHPSLAAHENPASDDEDGDKDHGRFLSTLIHETADDSDDYQASPRTQEEHSRLVYQKNVTRLHDYWCHSSSGIAIEDDTDAKVLRDKVGPHGTPKPRSEVEMNHNVKGSVHEINNYTRPFMSKIENNGRWDNVFGHGIISDTHEAYIARQNGHFIEWIIEVNNMPSTDDLSSIVIGISSDLMGEDGEDGAFSSAKHGFGFSNLGQVLHGDDASAATHESLHFGSRDVVHIILDYSDVNNWVFYAKVGDIEDADYDDLRHKITTVFDTINPGSYRLAVALYSQMDALTIASCKIHGTEQGHFYQELKSYSNAINDDEKQIEEEDIQTVDAPRPRTTPRKMTVIVHDDDDDDDDDDDEEEEIQTTLEEVAEEEDDDEELVADDNDRKEEQQMKAFVAQKSFIVHDEGDQDKIEEQSQTIADLQAQITRLEERNAQQECAIQAAAENESKEREQMDELRAHLNEYRVLAEAAQAQVEELSESQVSATSVQQETEQKQQQKITQLSDENGRLSHELKLAQDRLKSLDDKKQEMQAKLQNAIQTKMKLIIATSEEIDHYRKLIQQIATNKLGCELLSDLSAAAAANAKNGSNGYY
eukprot:483409_1